MSFAQQSALFAKLSNQAYKSPDVAVKLFKEEGFSDTAYYSNKGADVYVIQNDTDIVVLCRGTEVTQWHDIQADLGIVLDPFPGNKGKVHHGFKSYADDVRPFVLEKLKNSPNKTLWFAGHSLGSAIAILLAHYCVMEAEIQNPVAVFTYGSPRVGNRTYMNEFNKKLTHHRWVNNHDPVTNVPLPPFFYHSGKMHYINNKGKVTVNYGRKRNIFRLLSQVSISGILKLIYSPSISRLLSLVREAKDHSSDLYVKRLEVWAENEITK